MDPHLVYFQLLLSFILFNGNECYRDYFNSFPVNPEEDHEERHFYRSFRSQLQSPDSGFRPRVRGSPRIITHRELEEREKLQEERRQRRPSNPDRGFGSRVTAPSSTSDLSVSPDSNTEHREETGFTHSSPLSATSPHPNPFLEIASPRVRPAAAILPLGQDIRSVFAASVPVRRNNHQLGSEVHEARSRADFVHPLPAHSEPVDEPDPRFVNRNFRRPPQRFSRPYSADHLVDEETPFTTTTSSVPVESAVAAPVSQPISSFSSSSSSSHISSSNARRYPNYLRNADSFDRDNAARQLADQRRTELRMQEEERIKDEMKRLEDEKREDERIRLENDRRLAEEERARNDRRETEGLRLEAELNEKRDGILRQQERARDRAQIAKEDADRILESYVPIQNGRRPFDPEDHIQPVHHDPNRGSAMLPDPTPAPISHSRGRFTGNTARASQRSSTAITTSSTTTTTTASTTTTTTPAPVPVTSTGLRPRPAGRPGGRRFIGRHKMTSESDRPPLYRPTPATTSTAAAARADYEDEYEDEYEEATTTTPKPKRRRRKSTTTSTTPSTTAKTLSPGYRERADGRIIDFQADPNFPYELKGADLTDYPFYVKVPENVQFDCKGRHDGYYANVDLHCQIYHHCAIGYRYDFLCPNYTLFDQTTFTCRFINTVNCGKSANFYKRNEDLYVESTTAAPQESRRSNDQENGRFKKKKRNQNRSNDRGNESTSRNNNSNNSNNKENQNNQSSGSNRNRDSSNHQNPNSNNNNNNDNGSSSSNRSSNNDNKSANEGRNDEKDAAAAEDEEYEEESRS